MSSGTKEGCEEEALGETCAVCLETVTPERTCRFPTCGHHFHAACMISSLQHDPRCPVCRYVPPGVVVPSSRTGASTTEGERDPREGELSEFEELQLQEAFDRMRREWRRYLDRRRKYVHNDPSLMLAQRRLKDIRAEAREAWKDTRRVYAEICDAAWRNDEVVSSLRRRARLLRRRELRLARIVKERLDEGVGPEPCYLVHAEVEEGRRVLTFE